MVVNWDEQERVRQLLTEAITVLCKNGLKYSSKFCVEGLLGITLDDNDILLVNIKETIASGNGSSAGISVSPMQSRPPSLSNRSPMGMGQRMALTSPRRGRAKPIMSTRGRGALGLNRKRNLFSSPPKTTRPQMRQIGSPSQQLAMPLPDQSGLTEGPPSKVKREEESAPDDVIEIGDDDDSTAHTTQPDPTTPIKHETPDQPSSSTDPQQQQQETKFTLDSETNKSLTDFLDNLMTQHDVGPGSSSSSSNTPARGGTPLSQMSQMTPKAEPINMPWEQPQAPMGYSSPGQQGGAPAFHSPTHQSQTRRHVGGMKSERSSLGSPVGMKLPLVSPPESSGSPGDSSGRRVRQYHPELLNKAVQLVIEKGMSLSNVSEVMGIPMTTLWRKVKAKDPSAVGAGRGGGGPGGGSGRGKGRGGQDPPPPSPPGGRFGAFVPQGFPPT